MALPSGQANREELKNVWMQDAMETLQSRLTRLGPNPPGMYMRGDTQKFGNSLAIEVHLPGIFKYWPHFRTELRDLGGISSVWEHLFGRQNPNCWPMFPTCHTQCSNIPFPPYVPPLQLHSNALSAASWASSPVDMQPHATRHPISPFDAHPHQVYGDSPFQTPRAPRSRSRSRSSSSSSSSSSGKRSKRAKSAPARSKPSSSHDKSEPPAQDTAHTPGQLEIPIPAQPASSGNVASRSRSRSRSSSSSPSGKRSAHRVKSAPARSSSYSDEAPAPCATTGSEQPRSTSALVSSSHGVDRHGSDSSLRNTRERSTSPTSPAESEVRPSLSNNARVSLGTSDDDSDLDAEQLSSEFELCAPSCGESRPREAWVLVGDHDHEGCEKMFIKTRLRNTSVSQIVSRICHLYDSGCLAYAELNVVAYVDKLEWPSGPDVSPESCGIDMVATVLRSCLEITDSVEQSIQSVILATQKGKIVHVYIPQLLSYMWQKGMPFLSAKSFLKMLLDALSRQWRWTASGARALDVANPCKYIAELISRECHRDFKILSVAANRLEVQ